MCLTTREDFHSLRFMETLLKKAPLPVYLPEPDESVLKWIGAHLKASRKRKATSDVAKAAKVAPKIIEEIENGVIHQNLGSFRHILRKGYGLKLEYLLAKCYREFESKFNPTKKRRFDRDFYYAICLRNVDKHKPTPFLVAGDPHNFLWAVPFRRLTKQPLSVDILELAPAREKTRQGETPGGFHDGVEIVHVINGTVIVNVETDSDDPNEGRKLKKGDSIHFNSNREHSISNCGKTTPALLLIVRTSENLS
jgi:Cupin domain